MRLKLDELQNVVKKTIEQENASDALKLEIKRVLGPVVITDGKLVEVVAAANDYLDVLERTGRSSRLSWTPTITSTFLDYAHPEVRKFAARTSPEKSLGKVMNDRNPDVRAAVAARLQLPAVKEMMKRFPQDDQLRVIFKQKKRLIEAGIKKPEEKPMGHDPVEDKERLGDAVRTPEGPELSEAWYHQNAMKFMHDYGRNIEYAWEDLAVKRFCSSVKATSGVEIDESKLLKCIKDIIKEKEDDVMERNALKETLDWLSKQQETEELNEGMMPEFVEEIDPVRDITEGNLTNVQLVEQFMTVFKVQQSMMPLSLRKYRLGEGNARQTFIPCIAMLPHKNGFRAIDEKALDMFCEAWSQRQQIEGEPLKLSWANHPENMDKVSFIVTLQ